MVESLSLSDIQRLQLLVNYAQQRQQETEIALYALNQYKRELAQRYQITDGDTLDLQSGNILRKAESSDAIPQ